MDRRPNLTRSRRIVFVGCLSSPNSDQQAVFFREQTDQADTEDNYRKTFAQVLGGAALIATFSYTIFKDSETLDQAKRQFALQQFIESAKLLKESGVSTRSAGIYALEQVASIRAEFTDPIVRTVESFIRSKEIQSVRPDEAGRVRFPPVEVDVQTAVSVLSRRDLSAATTKIDLNHAYLVGADFSSTDKAKNAGLRSANFDGAYMYGARMEKLELDGATFSGSRMADWEAYGGLWSEALSRTLDFRNERYRFTVSFDGSSLRGARFDYVLMGGASFWRADVGEIHFFRNDLSRANFLEAKNLSSVSINSVTMPFSCFRNAIASSISIAKTTARRIDFVGADLANAKLELSDFSGSDFSAASLKGADIKNSQFRGVKFKNSNLSDIKTENIDFSGATFAGVNFERAVLQQADFSGVRMSNVKFSGADLTGANFHGACSLGGVAFASAVDPKLPQCSDQNNQEVEIVAPSCEVFGYVNAEKAATPTTPRSFRSYLGIH